MGADLIHIVAACDDRYAQHLAVMLCSVFDHHKPQSVQVHVIVSAQFTEQSRVTRALGANGGRVIFPIVAEEGVRGLRMEDNLTAASYFRALLADVLPPEAKRAIYLDCDLIVRTSLVDLWHMPLEGCVIAAVPDPDGLRCNFLELPEAASYFNSGVMLIDMDRWRSEAVGTETVRFASRHPERLRWGDQCALNWVLRGKWTALGTEWNTQTPSFASEVDGEWQYFRSVPPTAKAARIVHFTTRSKPWLYMSEHPFKRDYLSYLARTPWRDQRPSDRYPHNVIRKGLRRHAPVLLPVYTALRQYI